MYHQCENISRGSINVLSYIIQPPPPPDEIVYCSDVTKYGMLIPPEHEYKCYPKESYECIHSFLNSKFAFMKGFDRETNHYYDETGNIKC